MGVDIPMQASSNLKHHWQISGVFNDLNSHNTLSRTRKYLANICYRMHSLKHYVIMVSIFIKCLLLISFTNLNLASGNMYLPTWYGFSMLVMEGVCRCWMNGKFSKIDKIIACSELNLVIIWFLPLGAQLFTSSVVMSQQWRNWQLETLKTYSRCVLISSPHFHFN